MLAQNVERAMAVWSGPAVCDVQVEVRSGDRSPLASPHFRGAHHVVAASFGAGNVFVFDLRRRCVSAKVSQNVGEDAAFWHTALLPIAAGLLGPTIGVLPLHSACLAREGHGVLIAGESGAGKSTLAVALAQRNFDYISDDWTYCTASRGVVIAHGMAARVKLLPDAGRHFRELKQHRTHVSMNGELAFEVHADEAFGARLQRSCRPRMLLFFERTATPVPRFTSLDSAAARRYMERNVERLPEQLAQAAEVRSALMYGVARLPCWKFECGGTPEAIARHVEAFFEERRKEWEA